MSPGFDMDRSTITALVKIGIEVLLVLIAHLIHRSRGQRTYIEFKAGPPDPEAQKVPDTDQDVCKTAGAVTDQQPPTTMTDTEEMMHDMSD